MLRNSEFYFFAHTLINEVRALRLSNPKSKGTVFILDSTAPKKTFLYQQASLGTGFDFCILATPFKMSY